MRTETTLTLVGNLTEDAEKRLTSSGTAMTRLRVASTVRVKDKATGEWRDGTPLFMSVSVWRQLAEAAAELRKGDGVIVIGRLRQRTFDTNSGEKRTVIELEADEIGRTIRFTKE